MKKICFIVADANTARTFLLRHFFVLTNTFEIHLISNATEYSSKELHVKYLKIAPIYRKINIFYDIWSLVKISKYFRKERFDLVCSITPKAGLLTALSSYICGIRFRVHVFTGQVWYTRSGLMRLLLLFSDKLVGSLCTNILVDGYSQRDFLLEYNVFPPNKAKVLGSGSLAGVDTKIFRPRNDVRKATRFSLGLSADDVVFMFLGRINYDKGVFHLIEAFNKILKVHSKNVFLILVGPLEVDFELINKHTIDKEKVIFYGPTQNPEIIIQACDIFCLPSLREGFGNSVIEASAVGKAVICSDTYGLKDSFVPDVTGLVHLTGDIASLYEKMLMLIDNPHLRNTLGYNGRRRVLENFDCHQLSERWLDYMRDLLS